MKNKVMVDFDALQLLAKFVERVNTGAIGSTEDISKSEDYVSPFAAYLLDKANQPIVTRGGNILSKSTVYDTTYDFTMGRSLSEEQEIATIRYIFDKSRYLSMFNTRIVNKLVVPVKGRVITKENLVSNEKRGAAVNSVNRRIVHNFGVKLLLENVNLQKNIPLQTVINNMYNPNFETETMNDVAIAFANDILLLGINGLGGNYDSGENFYDLNKGFVKILMDADGQNTNSYDNIKVTGFMGKHLTPQKIDATGAIGANYNAANLQALMRKMYKAMLPEYRNSENNVWMMSSVDADLYLDSRTDMGMIAGAIHGSNTYREQVLTTGTVPNFMGKPIVVIPDMYSINEVHKHGGTVSGAIIFGDPKNLDIAMSSKDVVRTMEFNARGSEGAVFEYDFHAYLDFQAAKPESFVIAYAGAKASKPYLVTAAGNKDGQSGMLDVSGIATAQAAAGIAPYCDNAGSIVLFSKTTMASISSMADVNTANNTTPGTIVILEQGKVKTDFVNGDYLKVIHPNMLASDQIQLTIS